MTEILKAILYGIVEGITEWLPISSTGHLILLNEFLGLNVGAELGSDFAGEFWEMFEVVIQLGAILAVAVMFFSKLNPFSPQKAPPKGEPGRCGSGDCRHLPPVRLVLDKSGADGRISGWL